MTPSSPLESRLARIERALAVLAAEVSAIRAELDLPMRASDEPHVDGGATRPLGERPHPRRLVDHRVSAQDVERLVGTYGMLVIAVLAAVAAVGTFLSWAISHGYLTLRPSARVAIGLAFAAAIGVWGAKLRRRERSFGSSLLGLALVIVHVCAYAAGPSFAVVPTWLAFIVAAAASWALAVFAHREDDEPLWCVGFGGAAAAPFVTSNGHGSLYALLAYGSVLLLAACFAISRRNWPVAWRVFYAASALFAVTSAYQARLQSASLYLTALAFPFLISALGVVPFAVPARRRGALRWLQMLALFSAIARNSHSSPDSRVIAAALFVAAAICLGFTDRESAVPQSSMIARAQSHPTILDWIDAAVLPLAFVWRAAAFLVPVASASVVYLAAAALFAAFSWRRSVGALRDAAAFATILLLLEAVQSLGLELPTALVFALTLVGLFALGMHVVRPSRSWIVMGALAFVIAADASIAALIERGVYQQTPFLTTPSGAALILLAGLLIVSRSSHSLAWATRAAVTARARKRGSPPVRLVVRTSTLAPWLWAFTWVLIELAMAYSASTSTLLLVTYFAASAVGCVAAGRARSSSGLRQTGLALALVSAATAVYGAHAYFDFGARIAAYLVTSAFLLGIAYWYRRPGSAEPRVVVS